MNHIENAIQYVKDNHSWSEAQDAIALERINHYRCGIDFADKGIATEITELMEEYGQNNGLPEGWWESETSLDDIFFNLK